MTNTLFGAPLVYTFLLGPPQVKRRDTGEIYAMKVLKKENIFARNDPKDLEHTISERNVLALINTYEHPFLLGLKFAFHTPAKLYYVLNFCNGGDLYYLLSRCKKFKEAQARFYAGEVFCALQHLHSLKVTCHTVHSTTLHLRLPPCLFSSFPLTLSHQCPNVSPSRPRSTFSPHLLAPLLLSPLPTL